MRAELNFKLLYMPNEALREHLHVALTDTVKTS